MDILLTSIISNSILKLFFYTQISVTLSSHQRSSISITENPNDYNTETQLIMAI